MNILAIVLIVVVIFLTCYWQYRVFSYEGDLYNFIHLWDLESPNKLTLPFYFGILITIGSGIYSIIALIQGTNAYIHNVYDCLGLLSRCLVFSIIIIVKSYFGPLVLGYLVSMSIYCWFATGDMYICPVIEQLLKTVFYAAYKPLYVIYVLLLTLFAFSRSIYVLKTEI